MNPLVGYNIAKRRKSLAANLLVGINLAVFSAMVVLGGSILSPRAATLLLWGGNLGQLTLRGQLWRSISYSFIHIGILHLFLNMVFLWWFCHLVEKLLGSLAAVGVYFVTAAGAALISATWDPARLTVGASGAIFGIAGLVAILLSFGKLAACLGPPLQEARLARKRAATFVVFGLIAGLTPGADNIAHLAGLGTGVVVGLLIVRSLPKRSAARLFPEAFRYSAQIAIDRQDFLAAVGDLFVFCEARPRDAAGHALLGYSLQSTGQVERAAEQYAHALSICPADPITEVNLASILLHLNKADQAVTLIASGYSSLSTGGTP